MNKFVILFFLMINLLNLQGQNCLPSGITFSSQTDIDDFPTIYAGCSIIDGDVIVGSSSCSSNSSDIMNLNGLLQLVEIKGGLFVKHNPNLVTLQGLNSLETIEKDLDISCNNELLNFTGLENLKEVTTGISVSDSPRIKDFTGLSSIDSITNLTIVRNDSLENFNGLSSLLAIENIFIDGCNRFQNFIGLENITTITNNFTVEDIQNDFDFQGLVNLEKVEGHLTISRTDNTSLQGLNNLDTVVGNLNLIDCTELTNITALSSLRSVSTCNILFLPLLSSLDGLNSLTQVSSLQLRINLNLTDISQIASIDGVLLQQLWIVNNPLLTNCAITSVCEFIDVNSGVGIFNMNATGCNSETEIETACSALPVTYSKELKASIQNESVVLNFSIESQINNAHFEIEHGANGIDFVEIGIIQGEGTTYKEKDYEFNHIHPKEGTNYYRVKQVDLDGNYEYSNVVSIELENNSLRLYPNPVRDVLVITSQENITASFYTMQGELVASLEIATGKNEIDLYAFDSGMYYLLTETGTQHRFVLYR